VRMMGEDIPPAFDAPHKDKRFTNEEWQDNHVFDFIKQSYFLTNSWVQGTVMDMDHTDEKMAKKLEFYSQQYMDALSPSNFAMTNPDVIKETIDSNGENLVNGLKQLLEDFQNADEGMFNISTTDQNAFTVGEDLAMTEGHVVFENELLQLIQYTPTTKQVHKTPVLIIAPWINKYYILDMRQDNSYVKWLVDQGYTVFITSWVNPTTDLAHYSFEDYMQKGSLAAIDAVKSATGEEQLNLVGYCIGGTLTSATLAYLTKKKQIDQIKSATFLTTLVDFSIPGDIGMFVTDEIISELEQLLETKGLFDGRSMSNMFSMLRSNDMIWSFVVHNYLMGKEPMPFDLLYWNSDCTNMPAAMHLYYLRNMYEHNNLAKAGALTMLDTPIDVTHIPTPCYFLSTKEDHIAPWQGCYKSTQLFDGDMRFVLSGSGHVAGVVNPPKKQKYGYQVDDKCKKPVDYPSDGEAWLASTEQHQGSWWLDWDKWAQAEGHAGKQVAARKPKKPIEAAPGRYVKVKL
jgi:polyhydroxyalkanoate synthase